jgi:hypothetical protein
MTVIVAPMNMSVIFQHSWEATAEQLLRETPQAGRGRSLQGIPIEFVSPPLQPGIDLTPAEFVPGTDNIIVFPVSQSTIGVIIYGGGLIDPRAYSPLAHTLATRYHLPTVIPVFPQNLAFTFGTCDTGSVDLAKASLPQVENWIVVGHSFGGIGAMVDVWSRTASSSNSTDSSSIGGLVMIAADVQQDLGCGAIDFSESNLPIVSLTASNDEILNITRWNENKSLLPINSTLFLDIPGGNHNTFGYYDASERTTVLNQTDGPATTSYDAVRQLTAATIFYVAEQIKYNGQVIDGAGDDYMLDYDSVDKTLTPTVNPGMNTSAASSHRSQPSMWVFMLIAFWVFGRSGTKSER